MSNQEDPEAVKFWEGFNPYENGTGFARLIVAIYDHLRNTSDEPADYMKSSKPYSYVTPSMMINAATLLDWDYFVFPKSEAEYIDEDLLDSVLKGFYDISSIEYETKTRKNGPENGMPIIKRGALGMFIEMHCMVDARAMCNKLNAILAREDVILIDPVFDEPFKYPVIPFSAFPESLDEAKTYYETLFPGKWLNLRSDIVQRAKAKRTPSVSTSASATETGSSSTQSRYAELLKKMANMDVESTMRSYTPPAEPSSIEPQQAPATRLANLTGLSAPAPASQSFNQRSDAVILSQIQNFQSIPGESEMQRRVRFDRILDGVSDAQMHRVNVYMQQITNQNAVFAASAGASAAAISAEAIRNGQATQSYGVWGPSGGAYWRWVKR